MEKPKYEIVMFDDPDIIVTSSGIKDDTLTMIWLSTEDVITYNSYKDDDIDLYYGFPYSGNEYYAYGGILNDGYYIPASVSKNDPPEKLITIIPKGSEGTEGQTSYEDILDWLQKHGNSN